MHVGANTLKNSLKMWQTCLCTTDNQAIFSIAVFTLSPTMSHQMTQHSTGWVLCQYHAVHGHIRRSLHCIKKCLVLYSTSFAACWVGDEERAALPHYTNETFGLEATAPLHSLHVPPPEQKEACMLAH